MLQWHHLLSLVSGESMRQIENLILADGLFHVLMYFVTAAGLYLLWRSRSKDGRAGWRAVAGGGLIGFGLWNVIDVGLFQWILDIHRIRVDVPDPMLYDVSLLALLGGVPLIAGWLLLRSGAHDDDGSGRAAAFLTVLALVAAPLASRFGCPRLFRSAPPGRLPPRLRPWSVSQERSR